MKSSVSRLIPLLLLLAVWSTGFAQPAAYKHYEYQDINMKFDLPDDFVCKHSVNPVGFSK